MVKSLSKKQHINHTLELKENFLWACIALLDGVLFTDSGSRELEGGTRVEKRKSTDESGVGGLGMMDTSSPPHVTTETNDCAQEQRPCIICDIMRISRRSAMCTI